MKSRLIFFIFGLLVWCLLHYPLDSQHIVIGIFVSGIIAVLAGDLFTNRPALFFQLQRYLWFLFYIFLFIWECLRANIDIALRVIQPNIPLSAGIVKIKTYLKTDIALTFLANTMTLTQNTITVEVDRGRGIIYIHCISLNRQDNDIDRATKKIVERFEKVLQRIFE